MRNPALCLVGIAASPGGGGVFGSRAEEELRLWLETRLDALGIDPIAYSRFVLSLLRRPDSALSPLGAELDRGRRNRARPRPRLQGDRDQRRTVVQCLTKAADQKCGVEALVDELCVKLRDLEGGNSNDDDNEECRQIGQVKENTVEVLTPRDRALRYYAAFPALQPATPKKTPHRKDKNSGATNNNISNNNNYSYNNKNRNIGVNNNNNNNNKTTCNNNNNNNHSSSNSKTRPKKSKMSIQAIDLRRTVDKEKFGFAKSMEREREKERELELDRLRLAQLQAKFDESLEALWDSCGPGGAQDKSSIWAAPSFSIPTGPLWPVDTSEVPLILPINDNTVSATNTPYQDSIVDDSPIIPWDIDFKYTDESGTKDKIDYYLNWSDCGVEGPWSWKNLGNNLINVDNSPKNVSLSSTTPLKSPIVKSSETNLNLEEVEEDLLTSARTHFRPIKDDGHWADGTTFPVNNNPEKVSYQRSESGHLLYLPGEKSPYMKYRESTALAPLAATQTFTLKFRVRQCDKSIQTDPIRSPVKRRILTGADHFYYSSIDGSEDYLFTTQEPNDIDPDMFRIGHLDWIQPSVSLLNDRKRRHSSSFNCHPLAALRPLTL